MSMLLLLFFIIMSLLFLRFHYRKTSLCFLTLTFLTLLLITTGILPNFLLHYLERPYEKSSEFTWKKDNAIVLLGNGTIKLYENQFQPTALSYARIYETARLYFLCKHSHNECLIIISGGDTVKSGSSEALVYRQALLNLDIPNTDIAVEPNSINTFTNAKFTSILLKNRPFDQTILVTSAFHMRRALLYFSYFNIHAKPAAADFVTTSTFHFPRSSDLFMTDLALHENIGILRFYVYNFFNLNKKET